MPNYTPYPNATNTPNRKQRKAKRKVIFANNKSAGNEERKARRKAKKEKSNGTDSI